MATKKVSAPALEIPEDEEKELAEESEKLETMTQDALKAELEKMRAENERLKLAAKANATGNPYGGATDWERVHEACDLAAAQGIDPWTIKIGIKAPRRPAKEDPWYWLNVNGRSIQVPANERIFELELPWAQMLVDMIAAEWRASDYQDSIEVFDPVTNPHRT